MATVNPNIRITAAVRFDTDAGTSGKILKQTLKQQSGIDTRRLSRLSLIAALGAGQQRNKAKSVLIAPFFSVHRFLRHPYLKKWQTMC